MKHLLKLSYLGTNYCGFQVQPNGETIQAALQRAAEKIFSSPCTVTGCSRTDSGVHALEYLAVVESEKNSSIDYMELPASFFGLKMPFQFGRNFSFLPFFTTLKTRRAQLLGFLPASLHRQRQHKPMSPDGSQKGPFRVQGPQDVCQASQHVQAEMTLLANKAN